MGPSKHGTDNNRGLTGHAYTLYQRFNHALSLGNRFCGDKAKKWQCMDIEIQRHVVHSIAAFLDYISGDTLHHPLVKASVSDIVGALVWILQSNKGAMLSMAADVTLKLVSILPKSVLQLYALDLVNPLSSLLSSHQTEVAISCAAALNLSLSNLSTKSGKEVWDVLKKTEIVSQVITNLRCFPGCAKQVEYFQEMALLLSTILWWWSPSRFSVWSDAELMKGLNDMLDNYGKAAVLKLYSSIALCGHGTKKLLESGEVLEQMVQCMNNSHPHPVRIEGFKLAQCLAINENTCLQMMRLCCKPIIKAIISGMSELSSNSRKVSNEQMSLLEEACRLALITRWTGEHHIHLWKQGIDKILLDLLFNFRNQQYKHSMSLDEQIATAKEGLNANYLLVLRSYIWDILGWLAIHCGEDFHPESELYINILITCAWDVILEAKATELLGWTCGVCSLPRPHMHAHKVVLSSSCDYLRALFKSGMQESHLETIKVSISWEAMVKLGNCFYSGKLPKPPSGCLWNIMDTEEKLHELQPYVELFGLSEFWLMQDVQEACSDVIISCLGSSRELSIKILHVAANLSVWKLAEVAATYAAPLYRQLCNSGELESLDEMLVEMVRAASVQLSQQ